MDWLKRLPFRLGTTSDILPDEILPLSNIPAIVPPFFLSPNAIMAMEP